MSKRNRKRAESRANPDMGSNFPVSGYSELTEQLSLPSNAGAVVSPLTAQQSSAVFSAVNRLAWSVATLPKTIINRSPKGRREAPEFYLYDLIRYQPNPEMSSFTFFELLMRHLLLRGNFYAQININPRTGLIQELWPLHPDYVRVRREQNVGKIVYDVVAVGGVVTIPASQMLHIKSLSENGLVGLSIIQMCRQSIGLAISADEFGERFFRNNSKPSGYWKYPLGVKADDIEAFKKSMQTLYGGTYNAHKVAVVQDGYSFNQLQFNQRDSQFLETRQFQVREVARIFNMPPHMLGDLEKATFSNIEQENISFWTHTLQPWIARIKQEVNRSLISSDDRKAFSFDFDLSKLLAGDMKTQFECFSIARNGGWMSVNDIREKLDMNPVDGGDVYLAPLNSAALSTFEDQQDVLEAAVEKGEAGNDAEDQPTETPSEQNSASDVPETRAKRPEPREAARRRLKLRDSYRPLIHDAAVRCIKREVADVKAVANRCFSHRSSADFEKELTASYEKLGDHFRTVFTPILKTYFAHLAEAGAEELGVSDYQIDIDELVSSYLSAFVARHNGSAMGQLNQLAGNTDGMDPLSLIEQRLEEWTEKSPDKIENNESIRGEGYMFKMLALACGVTKLRWNASATACPHCQEMNGKVCGVETSFMDAGDSVDGGGDSGEMECYSSVSNPPLHGGCSCFISAD